MLKEWAKKNHLGVAIFTPGIIFANDDDVVPDVVWISHERMATAFEPDGKLHSSPELVVEVLSPGDDNHPVPIPCFMTPITTFAPCNTYYICDT